MASFEQAKIKDIKNILKKFIQVGKTQIITPYLVGYPGIGKSQTVAEFAKENDMQLIDLRLSQCLETDLIGIPRDDPSSDFCQWKPPVNIPWEHNPHFKNTRGILFLDELPQADEAVIKASFQLIYDHAVGQNQLNKNWYIVAAGNLGTEDGNDGLTMFPSALKDRLAIIHIDKGSCAASWFDYAKDRGFNKDIVSYLRTRPERLYHEFNYKGEKIFITPRRWEKLCLLWEQNKEIPLMEFVGDIGQYLIYDLVPELVKYLKDNEVIKPEDIVYNFDKVEAQLLALKEQSEDMIVDLSMQLVQYWVDNTERLIVSHSTEDEKTQKFKEFVERFGKDSLKRKHKDVSQSIAEGQPLSIWILKNEDKKVRDNIIKFLKLLRDDQFHSFMKDLAKNGGFKVLDVINLRMGPENKEFFEYHLGLIPEADRPDPNLDVIVVRNQVRSKSPEIQKNIKEAMDKRDGRDYSWEELDKLAEEELKK